MLLRRHKQDRLTRTSELEKPMDLDVTPDEAADDSSQEANNAQNVVSPEDAPVPEEDKSDDGENASVSSDFDAAKAPEKQAEPEDAPVPEEDKKAGDKSGPTGKGKGKA